MLLSSIIMAAGLASAHASPLIGSGGSSPRLLGENFIELHNAKGSTWTAGKTPFSDLTVDEFSIMMGDNPKPTEANPTLTAEWPLQGEWERLTAANTTFPGETPTTADWRLFRAFCCRVEAALRLLIFVRSRLYNPEVVPCPASPGMVVFCRLVRPSPPLALVPNPLADPRPGDVWLVLGTRRDGGLERPLLHDGQHHHLVQRPRRLFLLQRLRRWMRRRGSRESSQVPERHRLLHLDLPPLRSGMQFPVHSSTFQGPLTCFACFLHQGDHRSHHPWPQPKGTDVCPTKCEDSETLASTRHKGTTPYNVPLNKTAIMLELMVNGPSGNQMTVYGDFGSYKGGVYYTECGKKPPLGIKCQAWGHAVKILGWGHDMVNVTTWDVAANKSKSTMQDTQYWIGANSWSRGWGEDGFFRIIMNDPTGAFTDEVGFAGSLGTQHPLPTAAQELPAGGRVPSPMEQLRRALELEKRYDSGM